MVRAENIVKHYDRGLVKALNGVSVTVEPGEILALTGESGSGKSTLLNIVSTIDRPTSGELFIEERNIREYRDLARFRARYVGFVFQFHHLLPHLTLRENVEVPMMALGVGGKERRARAGELLESMELTHRMDHPPTRVSGGERQRAAIARALANRPRILLADEPTGSVDTETGDRILDRLFGYCRDHRATMILATHNREIVERARRVIRLRNGMTV